MLKRQYDGTMLMLGEGMKWELQKMMVHVIHARLKVGHECEHAHRNGWTTMLIN